MSNLCDDFITRMHEIGFDMVNLSLFYSYDCPEKGADRHTSGLARNNITSEPQKLFAIKNLKDLIVSISKLKLEKELEN